MTWCKYGGEFWEEGIYASLSDAAARTHAEGIAWLYRIEHTDSLIPKHVLPRFAERLSVY